MRSVLLATALLAALAAPAAAQGGPNAREAYVERRGLIEIDAQCRVLQPTIRDALAVSTAQARGSLLRAGWTSAQVLDLENAVVGAARQRPCNDNRTAASIRTVSATVAQWVNAGTMEFPGWERTWVAHRTSEGWRLSQRIDAPLAATFGVRQHNGAQHLAFALPLARSGNAPTSARLVMRDPQRSRHEIGLNQRVATGLEAGAPPPGATIVAPSTRTIERIDGARNLIVFSFPDSAFATLTALDPRESVEIELQSGRTTHRLLVEVGDIEAARAFLTIRR